MLRVTVGSVKLAFLNAFDLSLNTELRNGFKHGNAQVCQPAVGGDTEAVPLTAEAQSKCSSFSLML